VTTSAVYAAMQRAAGVDFKTPLPTLVDKYSAFLKRFDKTQSQVSDLEEELVGDIQHVATHDCAMGRRKLKEHEEELKPLRIERDKLLAEEQALLKPELKQKPS
jgi:hypothetical protein